MSPVLMSWLKRGNHSKENWGKGDSLDTPLLKRGGVVSMLIELLQAELRICLIFEVIVVIGPNWKTLALTYKTAFRSTGEVTCKNWKPIKYEWKGMEILIHKKNRGVRKIDSDRVRGAYLACTKPWVCFPTSDGPISTTDYCFGDSWASLNW